MEETDSFCWLGKQKRKNDDDDGTFSSDSAKKKRLRSSQNNFLPFNKLPLKFVASHTTCSQVEEDESSFLPTPFGLLVEQGAKRRRYEQSNKLGSGCSKLRKKYAGNPGVDLLEKMGFNDRGLGKDEQGMLAPIEVMVYRKNTGVGSIPEPSFLQPSQPSSIQQDKSQNQNHQKPWSKRAQRSVEKKKNYVTLEELLHKKVHEKVLDVGFKVYDMRGTHVKVLRNLDNINTEEQSIPKYNVRLLVSLAEHDVLKIDLDLRNERETILTLQKEKEKLSHEAAHQEKHLHSLCGISNEIEHLAHQCRLGLSTLESLAKSFGDLRSLFPEDYKLFCIPAIACSFALPLFRTLFRGWDPLVKLEDRQLIVVSIWKDLLLGDELFDSLYTTLFFEVVFPALRVSITNTWQPKDPEPLLQFLNSWEGIIPHSALQTFLDHVVMPKLSGAVDSWDPCRDIIPIHHWMHPWLILLGQKLDELYHTVRAKLGRVLHAWHPGDASAYTMLSPWRAVFDGRSWEQMMVTYIVPKLLVAMQEFEINPANQRLDEFNWVKTWVGLIPVHHMIRIMDVFFQKWQGTLYQWLCSNPDFQEVKDWFVSWRDLIPNELSSNEHVRCQLKVGLEMINEAVEGLEVVQPGMRENLSYRKAQNHSQCEAQKKATAASKVQQEGSASFDTSQMNDMSLKEVIEVYAQENNLLFKPKPGRMQDGYQVYGFGNLSIFIDVLNQKLFAQNEVGWSSVTLAQLVMLEKSRVLKRRGCLNSCDLKLYFPSLLAL